MAGRFGIFKQQMKERLGGSSSVKKSEKPEVTAELLVTESLREHVKRGIKVISKEEKSLKHHAECGSELRESMLKINTELQEMNSDMLASAVMDISIFQKFSDEANLALSSTFGTDIRTPFNSLTENELKEAKATEAKFEKTRVALDAAISEVAQLRANKKTKPESLQAAESKQEQSQQTFDLQGQETQETLHEINLLLECMLIEKWCDYMDAYREYFQTMSRYLNDIVPTLFNYKRYVQESKENRESVMLPAAIQADPADNIFGLPLEDVLAKQGGIVPNIVQNAIDWIAEKGLEEAGIFRVSPAAPDLAVLKHRCNSTDNPDLSDVTDPHLIASLLKTFFRDLPEPILTYKLYPKLIETNAVTSISERVLVIQQLFSELPDPNYQTLRLLMWLLNCIIVYCDKNMMNCGNLATVWAPNLMAPESINPSNFDPFEPRAVIEFIIEHYNKIFPEDEIEEEQEQQQDQVE